MAAARRSPEGLSRRSLLRAALAVPAAGGMAAALSGCTGFSTTGGSGMTFLSTQFTPVEEAERFRRILDGSLDRELSYITSEEGPFASQVRSQIDAGTPQFGLLGGLHGDLAPLAGHYLTDLTDLVGELDDLGWPAEYIELAKSGTDRIWYVPWAQASYVMAARKESLEHLPAGADVHALTYDQLLDWAINARKANGGVPALGLPGGPKGLLYRFIQGFLLPSFTSGQITTFRSSPAVEAWQYLRELWANSAPAGTTYNRMQEPLAKGEVTIAWDHVARLVDAPERDPGGWVMVPSPRGPRGLGYMAVLSGLGIPRGSTDPELARQVIIALSRPEAQVELLRANGFFPTVRAELPGDLPAAITMGADAVERQRAAEGTILSLPPVGLGSKNEEVDKVFKDCFQSIVLSGADIKSTLDKQAKVLNGLLEEAGASCWRPDPDSGAQACEVA